MSLSYAKCPAGDLHTGQILSLVCVDAKCQKRGLICPVCRMMNHDDHQVLPLKIFIDEVKKSFLQSQDSASLNNLSDYLRSIQDSRKQLLNILKDTAEAIAKELKKLQQKVQENYIAIRRNILAQSTMSTKLPIFIENLLKKQQNDPYKLQQEFQKYSELIKFNKSVIQISDKAKKIVEDYSELPNQIQLLLKDQTEKIKVGFSDLFGEKGAKPTKKIEAYSFSAENKQKQLKVSDDKKELYAPGNLEQYGLCYVTTQSTSSNKKITFRIESASSSNIILGMGMLEKDKELGFIFSMPIQNQHFCINSDGYCQNYDESGSECENAPTTFNFHQNGTQVSINFEFDKNLITFTKVGSNETKVFDTNILTDQEKKNLQFFASLGENDRVRIVESKDNL